MTVMPTSAIATVESMNGGPMIALIATSSESPAAKHRDHRDHRLRKRRRDCGEDRAHRTFTEANAVPGPHSTAFVKRNAPARMARRRGQAEEGSLRRVRRDDHAWEPSPRHRSRHCRAVSPGRRASRGNPGRRTRSSPTSPDIASESLTQNTVNASSQAAKMRSAGSPISGLSVHILAEPGFARQTGEQASCVGPLCFSEALLLAGAALTRGKSVDGFNVQEHEARFRASRRAGTRRQERLTTRHRSGVSARRRRQTASGSTRD